MIYDLVVQVKDLFYNFDFDLFISFNFNDVVSMSLLVLTIVHLTFTIPRLRVHIPGSTCCRSLVSVYLYFSAEGYTCTWRRLYYILSPNYHWFAKHAYLRSRQGEVMAAYCGHIGHGYVTKYEQCHDHSGLPTTLHDSANDFDSRLRPFLKK